MFLVIQCHQSKNFRPPSVEERKRFILCAAAYNSLGYKSSLSVRLA